MAALVIMFSVIMIAAMIRSYFIVKSWSKELNKIAEEEHVDKDTTQDTKEKKV